MSTILSRLHALRCEARALALGQSFTVHADAFTDNSHFDGPRYYCLFQVQALSMEWQDAGEAETPAGALENLRAALVMASTRLVRMESEFFPSTETTHQRFSHDARLSASQLLTAYRRADTAAQVVYARQRALGCPVAQAHNVAGIVFGLRLREFRP